MSCRRALPFALFLFLIHVFPVAAEAQIHQTFWGVSVSGTPTWSVPGYQRDILFADATDVSGSEFSIGFVRGRHLAGDFGVSFTRRVIADGSFIDREDGVVTVTRGHLSTAELRWFVPVSTIKRRVQIGLLTGFGAGSMSGEFDGVVGDEPARADDFFRLGQFSSPVVVTGRLEVGGALIVTPSFKVRITGGISYPGQHRISIGAVYLFGAY